MSTRLFYTINDLIDYSNTTLNLHINDKDIIKMFERMFKRSITSSDITNWLNMFYSSISTERANNKVHYTLDNLLS